MTVKLFLISTLAAAFLASCSTHNTLCNATRLNNMFWSGFVGESLYCFLTEVHLPYRPYRIRAPQPYRPHPCDNELLYVALLYPYSATEDMQVHLCLQPRIDDKWKLYLWDSLSTAHCFIHSIDTEVMAKLDEKVIDETYCMEFLYHKNTYNVSSPNVGLGFLLDHTMEQLDPAVQAQVRQAYTMIVGEKKLIGVPLE